MPGFKLQSAMEYLMTYGWAILIIAIVMVALFSLGILGGSPLSTTCLARSGYLCESPVLHGSTFNVVVAQSTGVNWPDSNVIWVPSTATVPPAGYFCPPNGQNAIGTGLSCYNAPAMNSGEFTPSVIVFNSVVSPGQSYSGTLWIMYQLPNSNIWYEAEVAAVNLKSV